MSTEKLEEPTVNINTDLDLAVYGKLIVLKKRGGFSSWRVFFRYFVNNKTLFETFLDEILKELRISPEKKLNPK